MEVHFKPATEARLQQLAVTRGKDAAQVVEEVISSMLERQTRFLAGVDQGIAAANGGEFLDQDEVSSRFDQLFQA
jgi:predicted transcriptional regulator